ncbi:hypothetical protein [Metapseudomonas otitidis]|uniref:hypothetical protein n=1 Tax=Metapseudomonas otitidis TaxID=319939 RepID=UPI0013F602E5|nr:hypothetical protein [Pseudomonas otitidis]
MMASYRLEDIKHETANHWVLAVGDKGYEVYRNGITHSTRVARIGFKGERGLERAKLECERREASLK